jgi:glycyl-tRNA synthetase beta chain
VSTLPFLLEIGSEEIPDWMIAPALDDLKARFEQLVTDQRLGGSVSSVDATPRRLVLRAEGLVTRQADDTRLLSGPPATAAQGAVQGFAKKLGINVDQLEKTETAKGIYWSYKQSVPGRATRDVLAEALPGIITGISWPKTMYWTGKGGARFIRPIRWIVALLGGEVVSFALAGVSSGNVTRGHRRLGSDSITVTIGNYEAQLKKNFVVLSASERRSMIENKLGPGVKRDESLIQTLVYLTEYPTPIRGAFDQSYLELPQEILATVMRHHQRYLTVELDGKLQAAFVAVMNTSSDPENLVRKGNERVLRARFNDARFFWTKDLERSLADRVADLANVTFQAKLGSYLQKTERNVALGRELAAQVGADADLVARAALLAKADLTTEMVKEFTELQGVVGGLYARQQGENPEVAQAIYEHYKPASMEDAIPSTLTGQVVALADKLDTLRGCFAIGLIPSGSKDPFALRRAAQGVVKIIVEGKLRLSLAADPQLRDFLLDRVRHYFRDYSYDEVNAVLAAGSDDLVDVAERLAAIKGVRPTENFEPLAASFKRIKNILRQADFKGGTFDPALLEPGPEQDLYTKYEAVKNTIAGQSYAGALATIASLRPQIDLFFDKVLVNAPDASVRRNRLTLLSNLLTEFSAIADFSEIVTM